MHLSVPQGTDLTQFCIQSYSVNADCRGGKGMSECDL